MRRASSLPEMTETSILASSRRRFSRSIWFFASRAADVATAMTSSAP